MGKGEFLGEFEQMVIPAILRLGDDAYGMTVRLWEGVRLATDVRRP